MGRAALSSLVLLALVLAPLASGDHVFSHRAYVVGRVVDEQGLPVAGERVNVTPNFAVGGRCLDSRDEVTGPQGDFEVCRHAHRLPENASVRVAVGGVSREAAMDPDLRLVALHVQLPGPTRILDFAGSRAFNESYLVAGRHFEKLASPANVEGIPVNATPLATNATATLLVGASVVASAEEAPDEHGDFEISLAVGPIPEGAIVRVESGRERVEKPASDLFRRTDVLLVRDERLRQEGPGPDAPGTAPTPSAHALALVAVAFSALAWRTRRPR